jgi:hypothetical protein
MRSATEGTESGGPQVPMAESQLADRKRGASLREAAERKRTKESAVRQRPGQAQNSPKRTAATTHSERLEGEAEAR